MSGLRIAVERHQLLQRTVADDDAGGVGRGVAVETLELLRDGQHPRHNGLFVDGGLKFRLAFDGLLQRDRIGRDSAARAW